MEALLYLGWFIAVVGYVWLLILAFSENIGWGIGSLLCGIVALIFAVTRWPETKVPALIYIAGLLIAGAGAALTGGP
jgi:hypothetical protein